jgi:hypothetical protein
MLGRAALRARPSVASAASDAAAAAVVAAAPAVAADQAAAVKEFVNELVSERHEPVELRERL